jgi:4-amino-4-deoxy-L-arabinose transferase-like glycosyltransferase
MVCLFHSDYGTADPEFNIGAASHLGVHGWVVNATLLKSARNIGEAEAIERHLMRGETVSWCDQGYAWAEQDAVSWFYLAALLLVVLPYLIFKVRAGTKGGPVGSQPGIEGRPEFFSRARFD